MAKQKATPQAQAPPVVERDPMDVIAERACAAYLKLQSPEMAWVKQFDKDKAALKECWRSSQRNAPWSGDDWLVEFVYQQGKSKPVCALANCGNIGQRNAQELHFKAQRLAKPPHAA
jgi:hypothetical protein